MAHTKELEHPAVELSFPLDGDSHTFAVPSNPTLFLWESLAVGMKDRLPSADSSLRHRLTRTGLAARSRDDLSIEMEQETRHPYLEVHKDDTGERLAWWIALVPDTLPVSLDVSFSVTGDRPTEVDHPIVLWTQDGTQIPWGDTIEGSIELRESDDPESEFATRSEQLWDRHTVLIPQQIE